ncbi:hypothetical protein FF38_05179 [Lucilia cuprina]|uniref:Uncharacterized protein n=1 Tax=Lucilia cuprina TaxID=7375 RepID=A0A0L0C250_LUCCU|nr:hypothetical protein FF38_05179 [Lucilia cuprina]
MVLDLPPSKYSLLCNMMLPKIFSVRGSLHNFVIALLNTPSFDLTVATRTKPSSPGLTAITRASGHFRGGILSSFSNTKSLISMFGDALFNDDGLTVHKFGSANDVNGRPIKKCAGVKGRKSFGSLESGVNGRLFNMASVWQTTVFSSSYVNICFPMARRK